MAPNTHFHGQHMLERDVSRPRQTNQTAQSQNNA